MKTTRRITALIALVVLGMSFLRAQDADSLWAGAVSDYTEGNYEAALAGFSSIAEAGYVSPDLYYNIGNCYYRMGHRLGMSILYYEKALKLDPSYEDAAVNLEVARQYTLDRIEAVPDFILLTWFKAFRDSLSPDAWTWTFLVLLLAVAVSVLLFRFGRSLVLRKTAFALAVVLSVFTVISAVSAFSLKSAVEDSGQAVVTVPVSSVKGSPGSTDQSLFILHEGTKVSVVDRLGTWYRIELSDGRQGWLDGKDVEII